MNTINNLKRSQENYQNIFKENMINLQCQICSKTNHSTIKYYYSYDYTYQDEYIPKALATLTTQGRNYPNFYADSRATMHITNNIGKTSDAFLNTSHDNLKLKDVIVVLKLKK